MISAIYNGFRNDTTPNPVTSSFRIEEVVNNVCTTGNSSFVVMKASDDWLEGKVPWHESKPVATECALYFCANMYKAESQNGRLKETVMNSWSNRDPSSYQVDPQSGTVDIAKISSAVVKAYLAEYVGDRLFDPVLQRTDLRLTIPEDESPDVMSFTRSFNVSYAYIASITNFFGTFTARTDGTPRGTDQMVYPEWDGSETPLVNALWESDNLTQTFNNVALSLTNQIRNTAINSPKYQEATGDTLMWVIHVKVQWPYLAFPIAMITLGIVYVLLIVVESTRLQVPV
ncbi:hypothetical protein N0V87_008387 [Didymella glomerata]|uniref:Uncharacterized protein n=1 Tax=Didymella glomerata TaxID=749621 RepID=A0A9W9BY17_9PLEO|nr:hypothetical protein N0V87_008387 [Didymella glomerata]